jgi:hypothetical protein
MRSKVWRSNRDKAIHVICVEGEFDSLPAAIRHLGPWTGSKEGDAEQLKAHHRLMLSEQRFVVVHGLKGVGT